MSSADPTRKAEALASSATVAIVCDALSMVGHRAQALDVALQPLVRPARLVGRARTVKFIAGRGLGPCYPTSGKSYIATCGSRVRTPSSAPNESPGKVPKYSIDRVGQIARAILFFPN